MTKNLEILLVEDNFADANLFRLLLNEANFKGQLNWVKDGVDAIDYVLKRGRFNESSTPDAIILDINLPKKNGWEVLRQLKTHLDLQSIPVFIVTSSNDVQDILNSNHLGATYFFTKPKDLGGFESMVKTLVTVGFALMKK